jgi:protein TonB
MSTKRFNIGLKLCIFALAVFFGTWGTAEGGNAIRKIEITPSTLDVGHAMYYDRMREKIEKIGTEQFPKKNGKGLYGAPMVKVPVTRDGSIYESEGGPRIIKSSGNKDLDKAALQIVRSAAPFGSYPKPHYDNAVDEVWEMVFRFNFTRDDQPHK